MNDSYYEVLDKNERDPLKLFNYINVDGVEKDYFTNKIGTGSDTIKIIKNFMSQKDVNAIKPFALALYTGSPFERENIPEMHKLILKYRKKIKKVAEELFEFELEQDESVSPFTDEFFIAARKPNFVTQVHTDNLGSDKSKYDSISWSGQISNLIYLNNDYDGGELYFPVHNLMIKPEPGMLISFPGNAWNRHGIFPASNFRFAISIFLKIKNFDEYVLVEGVKK